MNIVACASDNYTMQCGVLFYSVCKNNADEEIQFFVITDKQFTEENKKKLHETINAFNNKNLRFITVEDWQIQQFLPFETYYYTRHVFYRLLMADLLPAYIDKALYLDCDIIVRHNISKLWDIDISNVAVACIHDAQEGQISKFNRLGYPYEKGYFNSGVLLANLAFWREKKLSERFSKYIKDNSHLIVLPDQDVLNAVLINEKKFIDFTYNLQSDFLFKVNGMDFEYIKYKDRIDSVREDPVILHFSGARPWTKGCLHPYKEEFFKYRSFTLWRNEPIWPHKRKLKRRIFDAMRKPLHRFGVSLIENYFDYSLKLKEK